jgi:multisite-specific tRNA:(cytosine-C5)-methyltransferase
MLPKEERKAMLLRLYNDNSELIDHSKNRNLETKSNGEAGEKNEEVTATLEAEEADPAESGVKLDAEEPELAKSELQTNGS